MLLGIIGLSGLIALAGCGVRSIEKVDGTKTTELFVGPPTTITCAKNRTVSGRIRSAGLFATTAGGGFGLAEQTFLCGSGECHLAVWPKSANDLEQTLRTIEKINQKCIEFIEGHS